MSRVVQEKFEVQEPVTPPEASAWASDKSARDRQGLQTRESSGRFEAQRGDGYNRLPPGTDIEDQEVFKDHGLPMAGELGTGTQATSDVTRESLEVGFDRKAMSPTDDMYTREHNQAFYDSVEVDGVEGFVERNNYLDRL